MRKMLIKGVVLIVLLWVLALIFYFVYDRRTISQAGVVGSYISNYEQSNYKRPNKTNPEYQGGIHRLHLKDDNTYVYVFTSFDGKESVTNSNIWKYEFSSGRRSAKIVLSDFAFGPPEYQKEKFSTSLSVTRYFGKVRITINDDHGYYFEKATQK